MVKKKVYKKTTHSLDYTDISDENIGGKSIAG